MSQPAERIETLRTTRNAIKILNQAVLRDGVGSESPSSNWSHPDRDVRFWGCPVRRGPLARLPNPMPSTRLGVGNPFGFTDGSPANRRDNAVSAECPVRSAWRRLPIRRERLATGDMNTQSHLCVPGRTIR